MKIRKILAYMLVSVTLLNNILPTFAATQYQDSTEHVEHHEVDSNLESSNTTVYAEIGSEFKVTIPKHIVLDGANKTGAYKVAVTGDIAGTETIKVIPDKSFDLSSTNLEDVTATINQNKISWKYNEILENSSILGNGTIDASDITAGSWNGNFNFNISLNNNLIGVESTDENGNNLNASAENIVNEEKVFLLEELDKSGLANSDEIDAIVEVESDDFENLAKTVFDVSNIANPGDTIVILHFNEETNEWEYISTETVADDGTVTVYMKSYSPVAFVKIENNVPEHIHKYEKVENLPSCTENGSNIYTCSCGDEYITTIEALGHDYKATITDATCTEKGYTTWRCSRCEDTYTDSEAQALGHSFGEWTIIENANCVDEGSKERECSVCNYKETENINAIGHSWNEDYTIDKEATCTTDGSKSIHCTECNVVKNSEAILAFGHTEKFVGSETVHTKCSVCNEVLSVNHNLVETVIKNATCTEKGKTKYSCECGYNYELENIEASGHDYKQTVTNPTCTNTGYTTYICNRCNDTYTDNVTNALGHDYESSITKEATCTVDGNKHYECKNCDSKYDETIEATGHIYESTNYVTDKAATCTEDGSKSVHCNVCNAKISGTETIIPKTGHSYGEATYSWTGYDSCNATRNCTKCLGIESENVKTIYAITQAATCTIDGIGTYTAKFTNAAFATQTKTKQIPATGHTNVNGGTSSVHQKCSVCNVTISAEHSYIKTTEIAATCTTKGTSKYTCECGYSYTDQDIAINSTNHTGNIISGGTNTVHSKYNCCDATVSTTHSYTSKITTEPTCIKEGIKTYICDCGYKYTEPVAMLGHDYKQTVTNPTCTNTGYTTNTCSRCNNTYISNEINALGHSYVSSITKEATCTIDGNKHYECKNCDSKYDEAIAAKGHVYTLTNYIVDKAATCTEAGSKSVHCNICRATITSTITIIPATGHTVVNGGTSSIHQKCSVCGITTSSTHNYTKTTTIAATCTTKGTSKYTCECGYSYTAQDIPIDSTNHTGSATNGGTSGVHSKYNCCGTTISTKHSYTVDSGVQYKAATCTAAQLNYKSCTCGYNPKSSNYTVSVGSALGHNYGSPTYTWTGYTACIASRTCAKCSNKETENATITNVITKTATCLATGVKTYTATFTNTTFTNQIKTLTLAKKEHTYVNNKCSVCEALEPNGYSVTYTNGTQTFVVPVNGTYKLEAWGAQGGASVDNYAGGKGGYASGTINLNAGDILTITVGTQGVKNATYNSWWDSYDGGEYWGEEHQSWGGNGSLSNIKKGTITLVQGNGGTGGYCVYDDNVYKDLDDPQETGSVGSAGSGTTNNVENAIIQSGVQSGSGMAKITYIGNPNESNEESTSYTYTGSIQTFTAPADGTYELEVWGAQGNNNGGKGGYSKGYVYLDKNTTIYIVVGGQNGYNGGGNGSYIGGGATHIAKVTGTLSTIGYTSFATNKNGFIVAGGGGGSTIGGAGGGLTAPNVTHTHTGSISSSPNGCYTKIEYYCSGHTEDDTYACNWCGAGGDEDSCYWCGGPTHIISFGSTYYDNCGNSVRYVLGCGYTETQITGYGGTQSGSSSLFGQGNNSGGGGFYGGIDYAGGSGYIDGVTDGTTTTGIHSGNGMAKITYIGP